MPLLIRPFRHFSVYCFVTYNAGLFQGHGSVWTYHTGSFSTYRSGGILPSTWPSFPRGCKRDLG